MNQLVLPLLFPSIHVAETCFSVVTERSWPEQSLGWVWTGKPFSLSHLWPGLFSRPVIWVFASRWVKSFFNLSFRTIYIPPDTTNIPVSEPRFPAQSFSRWFCFERREICRQRWSCCHPQQGMNEGFWWSKSLFELLFSLSCVRFFVTPWTVAHQATLSVEFPRPEYRSGLPFPSPGDLPRSGMEPTSPALQVNSLLLRASWEAPPKACG